jgi:hypothetical protein
MSRHEYRPPGWPEHCSFVIGWDDPLGTYFGLVIDASTGQDGDGIIAAFGNEPPRFGELDNLVRAVNGRIRDRQPHVQLPSELSRELRKEAKAERPIVNSLTWSEPGEEETPDQPLIRSAMALGTQLDYLDAEELRDVLGDIADTFFRLERLYLTRKAAGLSEDNDGDTKLIRSSLANMDMVGHVLGSFVQFPDILVAAEAIDPFYEIAAEADRVLQAHAADAVHTVH